MLSVEEVACAVIGSAYLSGQCGNDLKEKRAIHIRKFQDFLRGDIPFPAQEVAYVTPVREAMEKGNLREYLYVGHFEKVIDDIRKNGSEKELSKPTFTRYSFLNCIPRICPVTRIESGKIYVRDPYVPREEQVKIFHGFEMPQVGQKVPLHWTYIIDIRTPSAYTLRAHPRRRSTGTSLRASGPHRNSTT